MRDAYYSIPIDKQSRCYLQFIFEGKFYQFKVLVFGLSTAPRIFTKVMKPVVTSIRAKGIFIIIHLDNILLAAPTFEECNRNTLFVIDLLESLGFRINKEKSELILSHHIPLLGFVMDSIQMSISLPMEKILSIQFMAKFLKDSLQTIPLRTLSKFIGMCSATRPAVFQAPVHYRHLQFVKNLVLQNSLNPIEAYNKEVYLNEKARKDFAWWESRLQFHCSQPINFPPSSNFRCFRLWLGDLVWRGTISGSLVRQRDKVAYKSERVDGRFYWPKAICQISALPYSHLSSNGQHNSSSLCKQNWGHYFFRSIYANPSYVGMGRGKKHSSVSCISSRSAKLNSRHSFSSDRSGFRMDVKPFNFSTSLFDLQYSESRPVCYPSEQPSSVFCVMVPRSRSNGEKCIHSSLVRSSELCLSPFSQIMKCLKKIQTDKAKVLFVAPVWRSRPWFPGSSFNAVRSPFIASEYFGSVDTATLPREAPAETSDSGHVAVVRKCLSKFSLPSRVSKIVMSTWRSSTQAQYGSAWAKWSSWCVQWQEDSIPCNLNCFFFWIWVTIQNY